MSAPLVDDDVRLNPADALRILVESEGWALFIAHVRAEWGAAAVNKKVRNALDELAAADHSAGIQALHKTQDEIQKLIQWPEQERDALMVEAPQERDDQFAKHRRV